MIVLDTNVLFEVLRPAPEARVLGWLASRPRSALFTTTVTRGEIFYGVRLLPEGRRRDALVIMDLVIWLQHVMMHAIASCATRSAAPGCRACWPAPSAAR